MDREAWGRPGSVFHAFMKASHDQAEAHESALALALAVRAGSVLGRRFFSMVGS